jgi:hypothetical protein
VSGGSSIEGLAAALISRFAPTNEGSGTVPAPVEVGAGIE